ncbi:hypothetical protein PaG_06343 [Moesziomyces aphidis]|uniref:Methyltransferase domain-containing protein n=1 Tax=Moesziomyces aphidis TaxID=84754 RepID=W3VE81_MOEAP|nr:hypothetical protein PaG_06343 [Moesziomyces aphidis]
MMDMDGPTLAEEYFDLTSVEVAANHLQPVGSVGRKDSVQAAQTSHRLDIMYAWLVGDDPWSNNGRVYSGGNLSLIGGRVMDLGCGQGDLTGAMAAVLAKNPDLSKIKNSEPPSIVGVDPASPDYGSPYTLHQAQSHLAQNETLKAHLSFILGKTAHEVLKSQHFDTVTLAHSIWYFPSVKMIRDTFQAIREAGVKNLLLAEWAMSVSHTEAVPHLLAVLLQAQSPLQQGNVRTPISPTQIVALAAEAGWKVDNYVIFTPREELQDGGWELGMARDAVKLSNDSMPEALDQSGQRLLHSIQASSSALEEAVRRNGKGRCMDVWTAVLSPA